MTTPIDPDVLAERAAHYLEEVIPGWDRLLGSDQLGHLSDLVIWTVARRLQVERADEDADPRPKLYPGEPL